MGVRLRLAFLSIGRHLHTERWIRYFALRGHDCHLLTVQPGDIEGVTVHDIRRPAPGKPLRYWRSLGRVKQLLGTLRPDLLNTHFLTGYGYWGDFSGFRPNVLTVWGDDVYLTPQQNALKNWLARRALRNADVVTGDSEDILDACVRLGARAENCYEVLWGVDFSIFHPERQSGVREELGIAPDAPVIFSCRSFTQSYYNIDVIIEACARLRQQRPNVHVLFSGYEGDPAPFVEKARRAGLIENTHFVGRIPHERFADYLVACDVFVSVPSVDATAVSLLEAMSCGRAVVVSHLASALEWVQDGCSGRVVAPRDVEALTAVLAELIADPQQREQLGAEALRRMRARAGFEQNMAVVEALYTHLVRQSPLPPTVTSLARRRTNGRRHVSGQADPC